ncbi:MAG: GDSL-type esterase/lipase family protein [Polyangiaceae bacterium]|nr:GDSL-type esterase/lipase family protein [Polyangiaceae bacterium]
MRSLPLIAALMVIVASCTPEGLYDAASGESGDQPLTQDGGGAAADAGNGGSPHGVSEDAGSGDASNDVPPRASPGDAAAVPTVAAARFVGRFDRSDPTGPLCAWPGCRIIANFQGSQVAVTLDEEEELATDGGPSEWDVAIDGTWQPKLVLEVGTHDYVLATGLSEGTHAVELFRRTEAQYGVTRFVSFDFGDGALLPPPPPPGRTIEIIGDSTPAGYGVEGASVGPDCPPPESAAKWENFHVAFGSLLGQTFGADVIATAYAGKGLVQNVVRDDPDTIPIIYPRNNPLDATSIYDFTTYTPDVVIMMFGSNDFAIGEPYDNGPTPYDQYLAALDTFVGAVRTHYPEALLLYAMSPSVTDDSPPGRATRTNMLNAITAVQTERAAAGDARLLIADPPLASPDEVTGCQGHGTPAFHARVADALATILAGELGW